MKVRLASHAGYCYGVERALKLTLKAARQAEQPIYTLGPIIHNPQVVESLREQGVAPVRKISEVPGGIVIVRSHGVEPEMFAQAGKKGVTVIDATCPFVKKAQQAAAKLVAAGYDLIIVGERNHPEVVGIVAHAGGKATVAQKAAELAGLRKRYRRLGIVVQTTQPESSLREIVDAVLSRVSELKVYNTICDATSKRQRAAERLAEKVDAMIIVGGKNSGNTRRLAQICRATHTRTRHIETAAEIKEEWFKPEMLIGVSAGASTPDWILKEVVARLECL